MEKSTKELMESIFGDKDDPKTDLNIPSTEEEYKGYPYFIEEEEKMLKRMFNGNKDMLESKKEFVFNFAFDNLGERLHKKDIEKTIKALSIPRKHSNDLVTSIRGLNEWVKFFTDGTFQLISKVDRRRVQGFFDKSYWAFETNDKEVLESKKKDNAIKASIEKEKKLKKKKDEIEKLVGVEVKYTKYNIITTTINRGIKRNSEDYCISLSLINRRLNEFFPGEYYIKSVRRAFGKKRPTMWIILRTGTDTSDFDYTVKENGLRVYHEKNKELIK